MRVRARVSTFLFHPTTFASIFFFFFPWLNRNLSKSVSLLGRKKKEKENHYSHRVHQVARFRPPDPLFRDFECRRQARPRNYQPARSPRSSVSRSSSPSPASRFDPCFLPASCPNIPTCSPATRSRATPRRSPPRFCRSAHPVRRGS